MSSIILFFTINSGVQKNYKKKTYFHLRNHLPKVTYLGSDEVRMK